MPAFTFPLELAADIVSIYARFEPDYRLYGQATASAPAPCRFGVWRCRLCSPVGHGSGITNACPVTRTRPAEPQRARAEDYRAAAARRRSEARRVGKECVSRCRSRWSHYHKKTKKTTRQLTTQTNELIQIIMKNN